MENISPKWKKASHRPHLWLCLKICPCVLTRYVLNNVLDCYSMVCCLQKYTPDIQREDCQLYKGRQQTWLTVADVVQLAMLELS